MFQQEKIDVGGVAELMKIVSGSKNESTIGRITKEDGRAGLMIETKQVERAKPVDLTRGPLQVQQDAADATFEPVDEDDRCPPQF